MQRRADQLCLCVAESIAIQPSAHRGQVRVGDESPHTTELHDNAAAVGLCDLGLARLFCLEQLLGSEPVLLCQAIGLGVGLLLLVTNLGAPLDVSADCCSLSYHVSAPPWLIWPYLIAVSIPFLVCSQKSLLLFGGVLAISCAAAAVLASAATFPSVWCFFAAVLSAGLYLHFWLAAHSATRRPHRSASSGALAA